MQVGQKTEIQARRPHLTNHRVGRAYDVYTRYEAFGGADLRRRRTELRRERLFCRRAGAVQGDPYR